MTRSFLIGLLGVACGGSKLSPAAARIVEGNEANLTDCAPLQKVKGTGEGSDAETIAKNQAREQAAKIGATHIRWIVPCCTYVEADAFRCDTPD